MLQGSWSSQRGLAASLLPSSQRVAATMSTTMRAPPSSITLKVELRVYRVSGTRVEGGVLGLWVPGSRGGKEHAASARHGSNLLMTFRASFVTVRNRLSFCDARLFLHTQYGVYENKGPNSRIPL